MRRIGTFSLVVGIAVLVVGLVFMSSGPAAWAQVPTPAGGGVVTVTPTQGGEAKTADGKTTVTIPAGAVDKSVDIAVAPKAVADAPAAAPSGLRLDGVFTVQAYVGGVAQASYAFTQALTICTKVDQTTMDAAKNDVSKIKLLRFDDNMKSWGNLPTSVDPPIAGAMACATTRSLSTFALAVPAPPATPTPTPTPTPKLPAGDVYLSGSSSWWIGLTVMGLFLVVFGGFALRRTASRKTS